jgi:4-hydroxybenzoate polyprenyltransferase
MSVTWNHKKKNFSLKYLSNIQDELIYGGYYTALGGPAFIIITSILTKVPIPIPLLIISYLIPLMVYSYDYYKDMDKDKDTNIERAAHFNKKSQIYPYLMISYVIALTTLLMVFTNIMMISYILILITVGVLYTLGSKKLTQKIPAFKNIYTTLTWTLAGTFTIAFYYSIQINLTYILIFIFLFLKFLPNTIFFDLKDIKSDQREGLKTLPVILGKQKTLKILDILNLIAFIPLFIGIYLKLIPLFAASLIIFYFYSKYYLNKTNTIDNKELRMIGNTLADAEFIAWWPIVLLIGQLIFI